MRMYDLISIKDLSDNLFIICVLFYDEFNKWIFLFDFGYVKVKL